MLFKPDLSEKTKAASDGMPKAAGRSRWRTVWIAITLLIVGGLAYLGWTALEQKKRDASQPAPILQFRCLPPHRASRTCRSTSMGSGRFVR